MNSLQISLHFLNKVETWEFKCRSFVLNMARMLYGMLKVSNDEIVSLATTTVTITDLDGIERAAATCGHYDYGYYTGGGVAMAMNAPANDDTYGIVVGSGSTPVSYNDYRLASKITHGTGAGQLVYQSHSTSSSFGATSSYVEINRTFVNNSGGTVTVREVGLIARNYWKHAGSVVKDVKFLIARDVLPALIDVPNLATLVVRYRVGLTL